MNTISLETELFLIQLFIFLLVIFSLVLVKLFTIWADKRRIYKAAEEKGWQNIQIYWIPLGGGVYSLIFEHYQRHYELFYDEPHHANSHIYCRTSPSMGVYWHH